MLDIAAGSFALRRLAARPGPAGRLVAAAPGYAVVATVLLYAAGSLAAVAALVAAADEERRRVVRDLHDGA